MQKGYRNLYPGMGRAVAERTILRKDKNGVWESWGDVAHRVALGNSLLCKNKDEQEKEYELLKNYIANGLILMSGRHLQHGDETQPTRPMEVFTNCSTSSTSFLTLLLLLAGSGVGRCYDDDMMLVNWDNAPNLRCILSDQHPDYDFSAHESVRDAKHKYGNNPNTMWFEIPDTREGWAQALEIWENAAFEKIHKDKMLILDFSKLREKGSPIKGMQNKPASGPIDLINAFQKAAKIKGAGIPPWKQAMYIDHYFSECVLVAGARRSARAAIKYWKDKSIFEFMAIKRPLEYNQYKSYTDIIQYRKNNKHSSFLWTANNSVGVDKEFWELLSINKNDPRYKSDLHRHAKRVFKIATEYSYGDGTGEPGFINLDKLVQKDEGWKDLNKGDYIGSQKYIIREDTQLYLSRLAKKAKQKQYHMSVNPCVIGDTLVMTDKGNISIQNLVKNPEKYKVLSMNLSNGQLEYQNVVWGDKTQKLANIIKIELENGQTLKCTPDHKIYTKNRGYVRASQLENTDEIVIN